MELQFYLYRDISYSTLQIFYKLLFLQIILLSNVYLPHKYFPRLKQIFVIL